MVKNQSWKALVNQLKNPFPPELLRRRNDAGTGNKTLYFIDARDVMKRLDDIVGPENWTDEYKEVAGGIICTLKIRKGEESEWVSKSNGASFTKIASVKGGVSDSLKRTAAEWGIGRYLYSLDTKKYSEDWQRWPQHFLPWEGLQNWEDISEMEKALAEEDSAATGMDDEYEGFGNEVISNLDAIRATQSTDKLLELFNGLDTGQQAALGKEFKQRSDELIAQETAAILKDHAKDAKPKKEAKTTEDK